MRPARAPSEVEQTAAAWFAKLQQSSVDEESLEALREWRLDPENDRAFLAIEKLWRDAGAMPRDAELGGALATAGGRTPRPPVRTGLFAAAGIVGVSLAMVGLGLFWPGRGGERYQTAVGEQSTVHLSDGSTLQLDTDSRVRVRWAPTRRLVALERGQALFDVAHDPRRPFIVTAGSTEVRALGTRFDVRRDDDHVSVLLLEGRVSVTRPGDARQTRWTLGPGQALTTNPGRVQPARTDVAASLAWTRGQLVFHEARLADVVAEANRYSLVRLAVADDPRLNRVRVDGVFKPGDSAAIAAALADLYDLSASRDAKGDVTLRARPGVAPPVSAEQTQPAP